MPLKKTTNKLLLSWLMHQKDKTFLSRALGPSSFLPVEFYINCIYAFSFFSVF